MSLTYEGGSRAGVGIAEGICHDLFVYPTQA